MSNVRYWLVHRLLLRILPLPRDNNEKRETNHAPNCNCLFGYRGPRNRGIGVRRSRVTPPQVPRSSQRAPGGLRRRLEHGAALQCDRQSRCASVLPPYGIAHVRPRTERHAGQVTNALIVDYRHAGTVPILCSIYQLAAWRNHWSFAISIPDAVSRTSPPTGARNRNSQGNGEPPSLRRALVGQAVSSS
jgi:hypothetical protein